MGSFRDHNPTAAIYTVLLSRSSNMYWYKNKNRHLTNKYHSMDQSLKWHDTRLICCFLTKFMNHTNFIFGRNKENHIAVKFCNETTRMEPYWNNSLNFLCEMLFEIYYSRNAQHKITEKTFHSATRNFIMRYYIHSKYKFSQ